MEAQYGIDNVYVNVTDALLSRANNGLIKFGDVPYNTLFGDPVPFRRKHLVITHPGITRTVHITEDTPITITLGELRVPKLYVVYFVNTVYNSDYIHMARSQLEHLKRTGLPDHATIYIEATVVPGKGQQVTDDLLAIIPSAKVSTHEEERYEYYGIYRVWQLAQDDPDSFILYFHSKGITHIRPITPTHCRFWQELRLFSKVIERWQDNVNILSLFPSVDKLGQTASTEGWIWFNFFWCRGSYASQCEQPIITERRHYYESWLSLKLREGQDSVAYERPRNSDIYQLTCNNCFSYYSTDQSNIGNGTDAGGAYHLLESNL